MALVTTSNSGNPLVPVAQDGSLAPVPDAKPKGHTGRLVVRRSKGFGSFASSADVRAKLEEAQKNQSIVDPKKNKVIGFNFVTGIVEQSMAGSKEDKIYHKYVVHVLGLGSNSEMVPAIGVQKGASTISLVKREPWDIVQHRCAKMTRPKPEQWVPPIGEREYMDISVGDSVKFIVHAPAGPLIKEGTIVKVQDVVASGSFMEEKTDKDAAPGDQNAQAPAAAAADKKAPKVVRHSFKGSVFVLTPLPDGVEYLDILDFKAPEDRAVPHIFDVEALRKFEAHQKGIVAEPTRLSFIVRFGASEDDVKNVLDPKDTTSATFACFRFPDELKDEMISHKGQGDVLHAALCCFIQGYQKLDGGHSFLWCADVNMFKELIAEIFCTFNVNKWKNFLYMYLPELKFYGLVTARPSKSLAAYPCNEVIVDKINRMYAQAMVDESGDLLVDSKDFPTDTVDEVNAFKAELYVEKIFISAKQIWDITIPITSAAFGWLDKFWSVPEAERKEFKVKNITCLTDLSTVQAKGVASPAVAAQGLIRVLISDTSFIPDLEYLSQLTPERGAEFVLTMANLTLEGTPATKANPARLSDYFAAEPFDFGPARMVPQRGGSFGLVAYHFHLDPTKEEPPSAEKIAEFLEKSKKTTAHITGEDEPVSMAKPVEELAAEAAKARGEKRSHDEDEESRKRGAQ
jgi:hypothetical protein